MTATSDVVELSPTDPQATRCGECGRGWDDSVSTSRTPVPAGRCPFEDEHATRMGCDCGHVVEIGHDGPAGYGRDQDGATRCYPCCRDRDLDEIRAASPGDKFHGGYLSSDGKEITNWPGGKLMGWVEIGQAHPWSRRGERFYLRARDMSGRVWSGTGGQGMYCALRLTKETTR